MSIVPLNAAQHGALRIGARPDIGHGASQNHALLGLSEIALAAADYPLCLMKDGGTGKLNVVALLGFEPARNLYIVDGHWLATWVPGTILRYPFYRDEAAPHGLAIDTACLLLNGSNGEALFDGAAPSAFLKGITAAIDTLIADIAAMQAFAAALVRADIVRPLDLVMTRDDGHHHQIDGLYSISLSAVDALADDAVLALHHQGYLAPLHIIAGSRGQLDRVRQLHDHHADRPIVRLDYSVRDD